MQDSRLGLEGGLGRNVFDQAVVEGIVTQEQADMPVVLMESVGWPMGQGRPGR
ncbi:MAG: hypothetical protein HOC20_05420 [Chloroflexi bacterium]|nr:hypothetical protein [Chloroflexota bacterium]